MAWYEKLMNYTHYRLPARACSFVQLFVFRTFRVSCHKQERWEIIEDTIASTFNHAMMTVPHHISPVPQHISQTSELASGVISRRNRTLLSGCFIGPKGYAEQRIKKREFGIPVQITLSGRDDLNNHTRLTFARLSTNLELRSSVPEAGDSTLSQPYHSLITAL